MRALQTAASGMMAQERNVEVISHNVANMRTTGYKRYRAEFQDLLYQNLRRQGTLTSEAGTIVPTGIEIGSGVKTAATSRIMNQGTLLLTEKETDVAIRGEGFFPINLPDGRTAYTRDGSFEIDANGTIVTLDGYPVAPGITVPQNARQITINGEGTVQVTTGTNTNPTTLGQIQLSRFVNKHGLEAIGDNLYLETDASGAPITGNAGADGLGTMIQKHLEQANVNPVSEISDLIAAQRAYEMNARVISGVDQMLSATSNLR